MGRSVACGETKTPACETSYKRPTLWCRNKIKLVSLFQFFSLICFLAQINMYILAYIFFFNIQGIVTRFWSYLRGKGAL